MPPRLAKWLLRWILLPRHRDLIIDDLSEEFAARVRSAAGRRAARFWFWGQLVQSLWPSARARAGAGAVALARGPSDLFQDFRHSFRTLGRSAGFTIVAVLILALGIGANTAVFTVVNGVLLKPLPYLDHDRLVTLWSFMPDDSRRFLPSFPDFKSWQAQSQSFDEMAFIYGDQVVLRTEDGLDPMLAAYVTGGFFETLRGRSALGTPFGETVPGEDQVVVLKHGVWQDRFAGDPEIIGRSIPLANGSYTVVAVMEKGADYPNWADIWIPLTPDVIDRSGLLARDRRVDTRVLARLRAGKDQESALADLRTVAARLSTEYPETNARWTVGILPLKTVVLDPWGQNANLSRALFVLMAAVGFVLLIACANLANLMLARAVTRRQEMAVRRALGAGRMRLARHVITESIVLATIGAAAGVVCARWGVDALLAGAPPLPRVDEIAVDANVLVYTTGLTVLTALMFGIVPALRHGGCDLAETLKAATRSSLNRRGTRRLQSSLAISQVGLALVLLIGAGLLVKSLDVLARVDLGFNPDKLISIRISTPIPKYEDPSLRADLYSRLVDAVVAVPGVESASMANHIPGGGLIFSPLRVEGLAEETTTGFKTVAPGYFETMGIAVIEGRSFEALDMAENAGGLIINQSLARMFDIGLGRHITVFKQVADAELGRPISGPVIGIVGDTRVSPSQETPHPNVFVPYTANPWLWVTIVARTHSDAVGIADQIRGALLSIEPEIPGVEAVSVANQMYLTLARERFAARLMGTFAATALLLSSVGIYGVMAYLVRQRTAEIGLRIAIGATSAQVIRHVVGKAMWMVLAGSMVGLCAAVGLTRFIRALLFGVATIDLETYAIVTAILILVALGASFFPARQAASVDPLSMMKAE